MRFYRTLPSFSSMATLLCLFAATLLAGCGQQSASSTTNTVKGDQNTSSTSRLVAPPVVLTNPSPDKLDVSVNVMYGEYASRTDNQSGVNLLFRSEEHNVQFAGSERLVCNGQEVALPRVADWQGITLVEGAAADLAGKQYTCTYSAGSASGTFAFTLPRMPAVLTPADQAQVTRSKETVVKYSFDEQVGKLVGIVALADDNKSVTTEGLTGSQAVLDTSTFPAGKGQISLTQELKIEVVQTGTNFKSILANGMAQMNILVNWV